MKIHPIGLAGTYRDYDGIKSRIRTDIGYATNESARLGADDTSQGYFELVKKIKKPEINILDLGGGQGGHFLYLKHKLSTMEDVVNLKYHIVDFPVNFCDIEGVTYYNSIDDISCAVDICYANAVLYAIPDALDVASKMFNLAKRFVILQRAMVCETFEYCDELENFYTISQEPIAPAKEGYLFHVISSKKLVSCAAQHGYKLIKTELYCPQNRPNGIRFHIQRPTFDTDMHSRTVYRDYYFEKTEIPTNA